MTTMTETIMRLPAITRSLASRACCQAEALGKLGLSPRADTCGEAAALCSCQRSAGVRSYTINRPSAQVMGHAGAPRDTQPWAKTQPQHLELLQQAAVQSYTGLALPAASGLSSKAERTACSCSTKWAASSSSSSSRVAYCLQY